MALSDVISWTAESNPSTHAVANGCSAISKKVVNLLNKYISFKSIQQWLEDTGTLVSYDSQDRSCVLTPSPEPVKVGTHDGISNSGSNLVL